MFRPSGGKDWKKHSKLWILLFFKKYPIDFILSLETDFCKAVRRQRNWLYKKHTFKCDSSDLMDACRLVGLVPQGTWAHASWAKLQSGHLIWHWWQAIGHNLGEYVVHPVLHIVTHESWISVSKISVKTVMYSNFHSQILHFDSVWVFVSILSVWWTKHFEKCYVYCLTIFWAYSQSFFKQANGSFKFPLWVT